MSSDQRSQNEDATRGLSTLFFRNPYLLWLTVTLALVSGVAGAFTLPLTEDPVIVNRNPLVITAVPGASAPRVEALVTERIEAELKKIPEVKDLSSTSRAGTSLVSVELADGVVAGENERVFGLIRDRVAAAARDFPPDALDPVVEDQRGALAYTLVVAFRQQSGGEEHMGILSRHARALAEELRNVPGTKTVDVFGAPEEEILVTVDPWELSSVGLDIGAVVTATSRADSQEPAGVFRGGRNETAIEVDGAFDAIGRVGAVPIAQGADGGLLRVGDVADIEKTWADPPSQITLIDGDRAVLVAAKMARGQRIDAWQPRATATVDGYRARVGDGVDLFVSFDQSRYTIDRLRDLLTNLVLGGVVVTIVTFLLMGFRSALIVSSTLPLVSAGTLGALLFLGGELHQMSVFGMIIALGLLIDNAIVVTDEANRCLTGGMARIDAVRHVVKRYFGPLLASTLTTILAFAPILLLPGSGGDFVGGIALSVIIAVGVSFPLAMTVTVSLAGRFGAQTEGARRRGPVSRFLSRGVRVPAVRDAYAALVAGGLRYPLAAVIVTLSVPFAGFAVAGGMGSSFFPATDRDMFDLKVWLPRQAGIERTREMAGEIESVLREHDGVVGVDWMIGASYPSVYYNLVMNQDNSPFYAQAVVRTSDPGATDRLVPVLQRELDERFTGARVVVREFGQGPPVVADVQYRIFGPDIPTLQRLGEELRLALQRHPDVVHSFMTTARGVPKLWLEADEESAFRSGLRLEDISAQLRASLDGAVGGSVLEELEELPVRVRLREDARTSMDQLSSLRLAAPPAAGGDAGNGIVPLRAIGDFALRPETPSIDRFDALRVNTVEAYTRPGALPIDVSAAVLAAAEANGFTLPVGYRIEEGGEAEQSGESEGNLASFAPLIATVMMATLILTFRSVRMCGLLLVVGVCCVGLALLSTFAIGLPIGFNMILGAFGLIGIALNNSIVVIASIRESAAARSGDLAAMRDEVLGCTRHILCTTLTTVGGFLPLLLLTEGDFYPSLAIVLAGGILGSAVLALFFVPAAYVLVHPRQFGFFRGRRGYPQSQYRGAEVVSA